MDPIDRAIRILEKRKKEAEKKLKEEFDARQEKRDNKS